MRFTAALIAGLFASCLNGADIAPQTVPELLQIVPVKYTAEQIVAHIRVLNFGAEVPVVFIDDPDMFNWFRQLPPADAGYILGLFRVTEDGKEDITVLGHWSPECGVLVHEFVHLLEQEIPERREEIRNVFHKITTPEFRIGSMDLEGPADKDAPWPGAIELKVAPVAPVAPEIPAK